jgi:hypothetical protein
MAVAELAALELAGRIALGLGLSVFVGLAFEEVYKQEDHSCPGGVQRLLASSTQLTPRSSQASRSLELFPPIPIQQSSTLLLRP